MSQYNEEYSFDDKPKRKNSEDPTSWAQAWQAIGIFMVVLLSLGLVGNFLQNMLLGDKLNQYLEIVTTGTYSENPLAGMVTLYDSPVTMMIGLVVSMVVWLIGLFIVYGITHFIATRLGGIGTLRGLIVRANVWMIISYCLMMVGSVVTSAMLVNSIVDYAARVDIGANSEAILAFNNYLLSQLQISGAVSLAIWLIWGVGMSNIISKYYEIGQGKGCMTVILLNISIFVVYCAFSVAVGAAIFSALR